MFIGPFFVTYEVIKFFTGYKQKVVDGLEETIEADIAFYRLEKNIIMRSGIEVDSKKSK